MAAEDALLLQR